MDFTQLISTLGFPIAACVAMAIYIVSKDKQHQEQISILTQSLSAVKESLDNNSTLLQILITKIEQ